jgi:hypothetical protein
MPLSTLFDRACLWLALVWRWNDLPNPTLSPALCRDWSCIVRANTELDECYRWCATGGTLPTLLETCNGPSFNCLSRCTAVWRREYQPNLSSKYENVNSD